MGNDSSQSLGEFLRQERERKGITVEQLASATKINVRILHAIEANQYAELPAKPFIRGFVSSYARFLGLDAQEILTRFGDFIDKHSQERPNREAGHSGYAFERKEGEQSRTVLWFLMGGFVVFGGIIMIVIKPSLKHRSSHVDRLRAIHATASPVSTALESPVPLPSGLLPGSPGVPSPGPSMVGIADKIVFPSSIPSVSPVPSASPKASPSPKSSPKAAPSPSSVPLAKVSPAPLASGVPKADPLEKGMDIPDNELVYKVVVKAVTDQWVRYKVDDKPTKRLVLRKDRTLVLKARTLIRFQVSDPKGATFSAIKVKDGKLIAVKSHLFVAEHKTPNAIVFPFDVAEKIGNPFASDSPLGPPPLPPQRSAQDTSSDIP